VSGVALSMLMAVPAIANDAAPSTAAYTPVDKAEAGKLIGHRVENIQGNKIGDIEAIHLSKDGRVADVIIGVGGFLEMGEHYVAIPWKDLQLSDNNNRVRISFTKEQLKAMPEYKFAKAEQQKTVFETPF